MPVFRNRRMHFGAWSVTAVLLGGGLVEALPLALRLRQQQQRLGDEAGLGEAPRQVAQAPGDRPVIPTHRGEPGHPVRLPAGPTIRNRFKRLPGSVPVLDHLFVHHAQVRQVGKPARGNVLTDQRQVMMAGTVRCHQRGRTVTRNLIERAEIKDRRHSDRLQHRQVILGQVGKSVAPVKALPAYRTASCSGIAADIAEIGAALEGDMAFGAVRHR